MLSWSLRVAAVIAVGLAIVTQSGVLAWLILPRIESALGCKAEARRVSVTPSGLILISNLRLIAPGIDSTAATFLEVPVLEVVPKWSGLLSGTIPVERIYARRPIIRLSQDRELNLNVAALTPRAGGAAPTFVPAMDLIDAVLDFGEHGPGWYTPLVSMRVGGRLSRMGIDSPRYEFELTESMPAVAGAAPEPLKVKGAFDLAQRTGFMTLDHIDLSRWQRVAVPERVREFWSKLSLAGEVQGTALSYTPKDGPVVSFTLNDVSLNVPVPAESEEERIRTATVGEPRTADALLAMRHVSGDLRFEQQGMKATLRGLIEDLPCAVNLETQGYDPARSPLTCHITAERFTIEDQPRLLPFAPFYVKRNFKRFSGPNGIITGEVTLRRAAPTGDQPAPLSVIGRLDFENGEAAFEKFTYPFTNMRGTIVFNEEEVRILGITGVGPTGAKLLAQGRVTPPNDEGMVEVDITVVDAPVDQVMRDAVPPRRKNLLEYLFSESALAAFKADGRETPEGYSLGGVCDIQVAVRRAAGSESEYLTTISVSMDHAGLFSAAFPYPVTGHDMRLRITDDNVHLRVPRLNGRGRSTLALEADVTLSPPEVPDLYDVRVAAANLPCDEDLMRALPDRNPDAAGKTPQSFVRSLGLSGIVDGTTRIFSKPDASTGFEVHASLAGMTSRIGGLGCLELTDLAGDLVVTDEDAHAIELEGRMGIGTFFTTLAADRARPSIAVDADVRFDRLPLREPVEALVALIDPAQGERLRRLRGEYLPEGNVSGSIELIPIETGTDFILAFDDVERFSVEVFDGRFSIIDFAGDARIDSKRVTFDDFSAVLEFDERPAGNIAAQGSWAIAEREKGDLTIMLNDGRFESPLVRSAATKLRPRLAKVLDEMNFRGSFELEARVEGPPNEPRFSGRIEPRTLALIRNGSEVRFDEVSGRIRFGPHGGEVSNLQASAPGWSLSAQGRWASEPSLDVDLTFGFESNGIPADLLAALPADAATAFHAARLELSGPLILRDSRLRSIDNGTQLRLTARADAGPASLDIGLPVRFDEASAFVDVTWPLEREEPPTIDATLTIPNLTASRATLTDGRINIRSGETAGAYEVRSMAARIHGGAISASASFHRNDESGSSEVGTAYSAELQAAGVDFASLLNDLRDPEAPNNEIPDAPGSRGEVDATLTITGTLGSAVNRRGRGVARIAGGEVIALPGAMPMLRLSNFQVPLGEPLESATASFYLKDETITFEQLQASSESLLIIGDGTMTLPSTDLNLRFNTQGRGTIPILDDILRGLRNELMTTVVSGTITEPTYRIEAFPGTQRMLGAIFQRKKKPLPATAPATDQETK